MTRWCHALSRVLIYCTRASKGNLLGEELGKVPLVCLRSLQWIGTRDSA